MCGIAGYISLTNQSPEPCVKAMSDVIAHRGPDGSGIKMFGNVAIGHRRLSIIDIATGMQPMSNASQNLSITYNGELYNFTELKKELIRAGITFKTNSDTEVIIYAYQVWGKECLKKFRGMFAFAIVDVTKKEIFVARDNFGIKPLYIYSDKSCVAFASEIQQFKTIQSFNTTLNLSALDDYLRLQYIPAPLTIFKNVAKLKPAHFVVITFDGKIGEQQEYWNISYTSKKLKTKSEWLEATDAVIKDSVKAHLIADVPFGAFLSGGIDSTLVVKNMSEILTKPVKTFSIGFNEEQYNELKYSEQAAKVFATEHYTQVVHPDALALLPKLVKHYGEPFGDSSALPTYYVCELAKKHVTMVLSGDGGDECFAGYHSHVEWMKMLPVNYRTGIKKKIYPYLEKLMPGKYPKADTLNNWLKLVESLNTDWRSKIWKEEFRNEIKTAPEGFEKAFESTVGYSAANKVQYMDTKTYMPYDILTKVDIASMCHSLEVRTPLIDKEVWEFAATIPEEFNINADSGKWEGKKLLKEILARYFPQDFIYRKKQGFAVPLSKWFSNEGALREKLMDSVLSTNSNVSAYLDKKNLRNLLDTENRESMWQVLFLEEWLNQYKN